MSPRLRPRPLPQVPTPYPTPVLTPAPTLAPPPSGPTDGPARAVPAPPSARGAEMLPPRSPCTLRDPATFPPFGDEWDFTSERSDVKSSTHGRDALRRVRPPVPTAEHTERRRRRHSPQSRHSPPKKEKFSTFCEPPQCSMGMVVNPPPPHPAPTNIPSHLRPHTFLSAKVAKALRVLCVYPSRPLRWIPLPSPSPLFSQPQNTPNGAGAVTEHTESPKKIQCFL